MLTVQYAKANPEVHFIALEPGYTATDMTEWMGGGRAVSDSASVVVRYATDRAGLASGGLHDEHGELPW